MDRSALSKAFAVAHPAEQIANGIADGQPVEIVGFQPAPAKSGERLSGQERQRAQHGVVRAVVFGDVEPEAVLRCEKSLNRPIAAVALMPNRAAILELDEGLQIGRAIAAGAEFLPADVGQIEDWHHAGRRRNVRQGPFDDAFEPDDWALPFVRGIRAENIELGHGFHQRRDERSPLPICIRPEKRDWCGDAIRRTQRPGEGTLERVDERFGRASKVTPWLPP